MAGEIRVSDCASPQPYPAEEATNKPFPDRVAVLAAFVLYTAPVPHSCGASDDSFRSIPACVYRLDARPGLRIDVPDALLRLLVGWRCAQKHFFYVVSTGRNSACPTVSFSRGNFHRTRDR